jgi:hypothetical protein
MPDGKNMLRQADILPQSAGLYPLAGHEALQSRQQPREIKTKTHFGVSFFFMGFMV